MGLASSAERTDPAEIGLTGGAMRGNHRLRMLCTYLASKEPISDVMPKLKELGHDIIGPTPMTEQSFLFLEREKPDLVVMWLDSIVEGKLQFIPEIWARYHTPCLIITPTDELASQVMIADAGAFAVLPDDATIAQAQAACQITSQRGNALREAIDRVGQLEQNLANRRTVEQAKWLLVQRDGMTEPDAHTALQTAARSTRSPLIEMAQLVIDGKPLPKRMPHE